MKAVKLILLLFVSMSIFSCDNDDEKSTDPDFSVLGISSVSINDVAYPVDENLLLVIEEGNLFYTSATQFHASTKHATIEYVVITLDDLKEVGATSLKPGVSIDIRTETTMEGFDYKVIDITRKGYDERVTYKIFFASSLINE